MLYKFPTAYETREKCREKYISDPVLGKIYLEIQKSIDMCSNIREIKVFDEFVGSYAEVREYCDNIEKFLVDKGYHVSYKMKDYNSHIDSKNGTKSTKFITEFNIDWR